MSYLNDGNYFDKKQNFYNALKKYSHAINKDKCSVSGYFNSSRVYQDLGLFNEALNNSEIAIQNFQNGSSDRLIKEYSLYSRRARVKFEVGLFDSMQEDITRCLMLKKTLHGAALHGAAVLIRLKMMVRNVNDEKIDCFVKDTLDEFDKNDIFYRIIDDDFIDFKSKLQFFLSSVYETIGDFDRAIKSVTSSIMLNENVLYYHYKLGELLFKCKNENQASRIFKSVVQKDKHAVPYTINQYQDGIIIKTNGSGTEGSVLTKTFFSNWEIIEFKVNYPVIGIKIGDLVRVKIEYHIDQGVRKGIARNVKETYSIHPTKLKKLTKFHCLINSIHNMNANFNQLYFVNVFYPSSFLMSFSQIEDKLTDAQMNVLYKKGYLFLEIELIYKNGNLMVGTTNYIQDNNQFSYISLPQKPERRYSFKPISSSKECPVCQMDEWCGTDGCPLDPQ